MGLAKQRGEAGEAMAAAYLELIGCRVLARNVRLAGVQVDLVVEEGRCHVVVEVKMRNRSDYGGAAMAMDHNQSARLARAARTLLGEGARAIRVDVVAVELEPDGARLRHYRSALNE
jgi:putative endonuclease